MSDLVKRAREYVENNAAESGADIFIIELSDRIEELEAALTELLTACETQFVNDKDYPDDANVCHNEPDGYGLTFGHIRRACKVLEESK